MNSKPVSDVDTVAPADLIRLSAAVSTRLCHDLAGPIGALNAGIELLADETDAAFITETAALLRHSAEAAAARLKFLRLAFGVVAGTTQLAEDVRATVQGFVSASGSPVKLTWGIDASRMLAERHVQGVLLGCLAAFDLLRSGGDLTVEADGADGFVFSVRGGGVTLNDEAQAILAGSIGVVTPRTAPLAVLMISFVGAEAIHCKTEADGVVLRLALTAFVD